MTIIATSDIEGARRGRDVLRDPHLNRGTAFTAEARAALGLTGLLPAGVLSLEEQAKRSYEQYGAQPEDLARNTFLASLRDRNEVLYYKLLEEHLTEILPVVYDPVIAQAVERYSHEYQRPDGVYLSIDDVNGVETALRNYGLGADDSTFSWRRTPRRSSASGTEVSTGSRSRSASSACTRQRRESIPTASSP